ncbi:unnamed protein product [Chrysoparadoxa australica]
MEIEHVNVEVLEELVAGGKKVEPSPATVRIIQDKYQQKLFMEKQEGVALSEFLETPQASDVAAAGRKFGYPLMLKAKRMAYDGRGNAVIKDENGIQAAWDQLGGRELYVEAWVPFVKELAVMVVRSVTGDVASYPVVDAVQLDSICYTTLAPARISQQAQAAAKKFAETAVASLQGAGVFGVEMFLLADDTILLNEIAPRPHNTGHYTIEACECDQFENHLRAMLGLPLGGTDLVVGASMMLNILGSGDTASTTVLMQKALEIPGASIHWYGKGEARKGRKMGHITFCAPSMRELSERVKPYGLSVCDEAGKEGCSGNLVGVIMGSDSDLPTMRAAADILDKFSVPYELTIVSAHRTPQRMTEYASTAAAKGLKVIIAGAGGAAHLPGMCAAMTTLPVIGVPVKTSTLSGVDSLHSIVQMPRGVPVATVAIGNATNAGLLAVRMLSMSDERLASEMEQYLATAEGEVLAKADKMSAMGWRAYLEGKEDKSLSVGI